eukprot:gb/GFBE01050809.1/.p1 GENE.gb/GFBE01050809.1/~~gb/GFBE01050809.1/.p1  ORF type:complete len:124 (+),score=19.60 gb/GFBE01050809.1/:1-372(+)
MATSVSRARAFLVRWLDQRDADLLGLCFGSWHSWLGEVKSRTQLRAKLRGLSEDLGVLAQRRDMPSDVDKLPTLAEFMPQATADAVPAGADTVLPSAVDPAAELEVCRHRAEQLEKMCVETGM